MSFVFQLSQITIKVGTTSEYQSASSAKFAEYAKKHPNKWVSLDIQDPRRTQSQNSALHVFFTLLAGALNDAGYSVQLVLKEKIELDWTPQMVKELLWRPAQKAILGKGSTTDLKKIEDIDRVYDHINRHIGQKFQIHIPFPNDQEVAVLKTKTYKK